MSSKFAARSYESELLDAPDIPRELLFRNLRELDFINRTLGGHAVTLSGMKRLIRDPQKTYHIIDIGCGGGDAMKEIAWWAHKKGFRVKLTGVDMNENCIEFMRAACKDQPSIDGVVMDYRNYLEAGNKVDIIHCSLFCHHLKDEELIELFHYMNTYASTGFVINDLHRHWFAYYSIKILTRLLKGSELVKNDAPLSVLRGFRRKELVQLFKRAGVQNAIVSWRWAFRYLAIKNTENQKE